MSICCWWIQGRTYRTRLAIKDLRHITADLRHIVLDARNGHVGIYGQLGLKGNSQRQPSKNHRTYVKDMKNPVEVRLPAPNRFLIILCMEQSGDQIPSTLLDDFFLDLHYGPAIECVMGGCA